MAEACDFRGLSGVLREAVWVGESEDGSWKSEVGKEVRSRRSEVGSKKFVICHLSAVGAIQSRSYIVGPWEYPLL
jgi:hypothetical protein